MSKTFTYMSKGELLAALKQFSGTTQYYIHPLFKAFRYTDGVRFLAINAECYWLLEFIFSYQNNAKIKAISFQTWKLVRKGDGCTITVDDGNGKIIKSFNLNFTTFPLNSFTLWMIDKVLLLPSEY